MPCGIFNQKVSKDQKVKKSKSNDFYFEPLVSKEQTYKEVVMKDRIIPY